MKKGYADIVLGLQYGDEGKARVVDYLAKDYDVIARFNGGSNAGHTIENDKGSIAVRQIPSGIFYPNKTLYIGTGCAVNIEKLAGEMTQLKKLDLDVSSRLKISSLASIIQPHHLLLDEMLGKSIGTTKNGIGPSYADRATRMVGDRMVNIRLADLVDQPNEFFANITKNLDATIKDYTLKNLDVKKIVQDLKKAFAQIKPFIELDPLYLEKKVAKGATVLFE
ncbi:MAG TPA: adenylosuccinate synthetase, partial [Methylomirabilota bacterium]|nr:adenylosuccinate synthetase [Methylomirabilota bacterium]